MSRRLLLAAGGGGGGVTDPPDPLPGVYPWNGPVNLVVDGNSIYADYGSALGGFSNQIMSVPPFDTSGYTHADCAISGQNWDEMTAAAGDVDAAYVPGVTNVLVAAETTNQVYSDGSTVEQCITAATAYLTRVRSVHPDWIILLVGSIPAEDYYTEELEIERNEAMMAVDDYMAAHFDAMGADGFVGLRDLPPFVGNGVTTPYAEFADCWLDHIHPSDAGKVYMRDRIAEGLYTLPAEH